MTGLDALITGPIGGFVEAVLKGTLFLGLLFLAHPFLRRLSAGARHLVWGAGLAVLVALPLLSRVVPWRLGVLPAATPPAPAVLERGAAPAELPHDAGAPVTPTTGAASPGVAPAPEVHRTPSAPWPRPSLALILFGAWVAGVIAVFARMYLSHRAARRIVASGRPVEGEAWDDARHWAAAHLGLEPAPAVLLTSLLPLPVTTGLRVPVVLLPAEAEEWSAARRESVLLHEMAHIRRGDLLTQLAARIACALWWFHPLAWRALFRFRAESERAADDLVLAAGRRPSEYAQDLLAVVQDAGKGRAPMHALAMAQRTDFEGRLLAILEPGASRRGVTPMTAIPLILAVSVTALPFAALSPATPAPTVAAPVAEAQQPARVVTPTPTPTPTVSLRPAIAAAVARGVRGALPVAAPAAVLAGGRSRSSAQSRQAALGLVGALRDADVGVRESAATGLGQLGVQDTAVVAALGRALTTDADAGVRRAAAWALGQLEQAAAVPALAAALAHDRDVEVRRECAWALGQVEDAAAVDPLVAALSDPDAELRGKAVWALGQIEDARAVGPLVNVLRDADPETRAQAAWALGQIESKDATEGLGRAASDTSPHVRSQVAWALGQIEDARAVPALGRLLHDPVAEVRKQAAWALGQIEDQGSAEPLAGALDDSDAEVRQNAAWALGQVGVQRIPPALITALADADAGVRKNAAWAAGQIGDGAAIPALNKLLLDTDREVQKTAVWALGQMDDPRALDGLTRLLQSPDPELRRMAVQALGRSN